MSLLSNKCLLLKALIIIISKSFCCWNDVKAQEFASYKKDLYLSGSDTLPYRILLPLDYDSNKSYPLLIFLHGSGEKGSDNEKQLTHGGKLFLKEDVRRNYPAIVVFPQCPSSSYWSNVDIKTEGNKRKFYFKSGGNPTVAMKLAIELLDQLQLSYPINKNQVYVGGLSMGGMGTYEIVRRNPDLFSAAFVICGGGDPKTAPLLKNTSWWIFHGGEDDIVPPKFAEIMQAALEKQKADVRMTIYYEANHNSWDPAFAEPTLLSWLFSQNKENKKIKKSKRK